MARNEISELVLDSSGIIYRIRKERREELRQLGNFLGLSVDGFVRIVRCLLQASGKGIVTFPAGGVVKNGGGCYAFIDWEITRLGEAALGAVGDPRDKRYLYKRRRKGGKGVK